MLKRNDSRWSFARCYSQRPLFLSLVMVGMALCTTQSQAQPQAGALLKYRIEGKENDYQKLDAKVPESVDAEIRRYRSLGKIGRGVELNRNDLIEAELKKIRENPNKYFFVVRLTKREESSTLQAIATHITPKDSAARDKIEIHFYLPNVAFGTRIYATATVQNGSPDIDRTGLSDPERESFLGTPLSSKGKALGAWDLENEDALVQIEQVDGKFQMAKCFADGGSERTDLLAAPKKKNSFTYAGYPDPVNPDNIAIENGQLVFYKAGKITKTLSKLPKVKLSAKEQNENDIAIKNEKIKLATFYNRMIKLKKNQPADFRPPPSEEQLEAAARLGEKLQPSEEQHEAYSARYETLAREIGDLSKARPVGKCYFPLELRAAAASLGSIAHHHFYADLREGTANGSMGKPRATPEQQIVDFKAAIDYDAISTEVAVNAEFNDETPPPARKKKLRGVEAIGLHDARKWTDATGEFSVEAKLEATYGDVLDLRTTDGRLIRVPFDRLSVADQDLIENSHRFPEFSDGKEVSNNKKKDKPRSLQSKNKPPKGENIFESGEVKYTYNKKMLGEPPPSRKWIDIDGKVIVEGSLEWIGSESVKVRTTDGRLVEVPTERLSKDDQDNLVEKGYKPIDPLTYPYRFRDWTDSDGKVIVNGKLRALHEKGLIVTTTDGRNVLVPLDRLSKLDREIVDKYRAAMSK